MTKPPTTSSSEEPKDDVVPPQNVAKKSLFQKLWDLTGLNPLILTLMFKGALAPTIALAAYQSNAFSDQYTTLGYLVAIMALLSLPIQPRAKFVQAMTTSVFFVCLGAAVTLLQIRCTVAARMSSTPPGVLITGQSGSTQSTQYSGAASTVSGIWLFLTIWTANAVRAYRPQLMLPSIQYSIFTIVGSVYAPLFPGMAAGKDFVRRLLITFLTGFGIATGVSLFIFPVTSRKMSKGQIGGLITTLKSILDAHGSYMHSITVNDNDEGSKSSKESSEAAKLQKLVAEAGGQFGKIRLELGFAKKEIGWGKLCPEDFSDIFRHLRDILLPEVSLSTFLHIMQSARERCDVQATTLESTDTLDVVRRLEREEWDEVLAMSKEPYIELQKSLCDGLDHISYQLEINDKPKKKLEDAEKDEVVRPGNANFTTKLEADLNKFHSYRETVIKRWCDSKGINMPTTFWEDREAMISLERVTTAVMRQKQNQQQLYLILYVEFLVHSIGKAIVDMSKYADSKVQDGTMSSPRLINPGWRRIKKLLWSALHAKGISDNMLSDSDADYTRVWIGDSLKQRKDPEHLPPKGIYQRTTHYFRSIPKVLSSPEAAFAFRAAVATMSLGVVAFLRQTWVFFLRQRGLWALIMVAISMGAHSGQGVFGFVARIFGTCVAMVGALVLWYVGYKQPGAIIPLFQIYAMCGLWFLIKNPNYAIIGMISMVTCVLIIGYELQADKIGIDRATSNGQPYYPIYLLGPYRLAAVSVGLATAFIWTYFPYPVTTHSTLRKDLGHTLYLLANHYSCVHATIDAKLRLGVVANDKNSPMAKLEKARYKVLHNCLLMIAQLREHSRFTKFDITLGGKFPKKKYDELIDSISKIFQYLNLIAYSTDAFVAAGSESAWLKDFRRFTSEINITSHDFTSTLCLVSASLINGQPVPPYLKVPRSYALAQRMEFVDPEILSVKHVAEPCYAAFAVLEVASTLLTEEMRLVVRNIQDLVGEVDFTFSVEPINSTQASSLSEAEKGKKS